RLRSGRKIARRDVAGDLPEVVDAVRLIGCQGASWLHGRTSRDRREAENPLVTLAPERHGPGGPTGLQNRCGVATPRSVGSTPAPLRQETTVRPSKAAEQLPF